MPLYDLGCKQCDQRMEAFISLANFNQPITPCGCGGERFRMISAARVIGDIEPYQAMGRDVATGTAPMITSRSQHRDYLKRNNYTEIGTERPVTKREETISNREIGQQIKQTIDQKGLRL